jgi:hypothetical protein
MQFLYKKNKGSSLMLKRLLITLALLSLSFSAVLALGTDDEGNPNDPNVNERANACFGDGSMEGKCDTDWEWECGWHLIRFEYELTSREDFPTKCASLLPPIPEGETVADNGAGCYTNGEGSFYYNGVPNQPFNIAFFESPNCSGQGFSFPGGYLVLAPTEENALDICGIGSDVANTAGEGFNTPANYWFCLTAEEPR